MIVYLSIEEIMYIHDNMIQIYGGRSDVHDFTLLHSATERSKATFNGRDLYESLFDKASAFIQSLILNHPFDDGNKRTAFTSCAGFLYLNKYELEFTKNEAIKFTLHIDDHTLSFDEISDWLKVHSKKLS